MGNYIVSARKYRPSRFDEVVGQQNVTNTLKNAIRNQQLAHSFLFCGPRGIGKTTCARILAKTINCENLADDFEACGTCTSCKSFQQNGSLNIFEMDAASNSHVDDIRSLIEQVRYAPQTGTYKIYIIDEVHMLSQSAFNAFLKTLEEPPEYAIFILATTEKHKLLPTILSRCQIFDFSRIRLEDIVDHLSHICEKEGIEADRNGLHIIAQKADGALRDALSMFDRLLTFSNNSLTLENVLDNLNILDYDYYFRVTDALMTGDVSTVLLIFDEILRKGFEGDIFINGLAEHFRDLLVCKDPNTASLLEVTGDLKQRYQEQAAVAPASFLLNALNLANQCDVNYKTSKNKRLHVELALIKIGHLSQAVELAKGQSAEEQGSNGQNPSSTASHQQVKKKSISNPPSPSDKTTEDSTSRSSSAGEKTNGTQPPPPEEQPAKTTDTQASTTTAGNWKENPSELQTHQEAAKVSDNSLPLQEQEAAVDREPESTEQKRNNYQSSDQQSNSEANEAEEPAGSGQSHETNRSYSDSQPNEEGSSTDHALLASPADAGQMQTEDQPVKEEAIAEESAPTSAQNGQQPKQQPDSSPAQPQNQQARESMNGSFTLYDLQNNRIKDKEETSQVAEPEEEIDENIQLDTEKLLEVWQEYTEELYKNKRLSLYGFMKDITPTVEGPTVQIVLTNQLQEEIFSNERQQLGEYLKQKMGVSSLRLQISIDKSKRQQTSNRPFTAKEKMQKMASKNAKLLTLKEELALDLTY